MMTSTVALSIDAMLPVLPQIGAAISPGDVNRAPLIIAAFVLGMGAGTFFTGPLSDAFGRKPVAAGGALIYIIAALVCAASPTLETMLVARAVQGLGAAGPRVVAIALVRDLYKGREMARTVSLVMIIFMLVPILAPSMGAAIAWGFGWRAIFYSFAIFSILSTAWLLLRQPETLAVENRRPFRASVLVQGVKEVLTHRQVVLGIAVQTLVFAVLFATLMSTQAVFDQIFGYAASFPLWFGLIALISAAAPLLNSVIVMRLGMREVVKWALVVQALATVFFLALVMTGAPAAPGMFAATFAWLTLIFFMAGLCIGNASAIALEPMGHMSGMAASVVTAASTLLSALLAAPVAQAFNGTMQPLALGVLAFSILGLAAILAVPRGT
ncbi:MAG: multidrug effflux MFS transporter [Silicimonas sp.]|nr:multidrug effflux MFS transporter [Silicimonas sp.]